MTRLDLLALTPEAVASLANLGLVKRAQRDLAEGAAPSLAEDEAGVVTGTFADGVVARLPPGRTLKDSPCTCGAASTCRHRVAVALAYPAWHAERGGDAASTDPGEWSPADLDDAALGTTLGPKILARAEKALRKGLLVTVEHGTSTPPAARLPSCTVRFLVPRDLAYARCDCVEAGACEHLALAVWAFREARGADGVVALGGDEGATQEASGIDDLAALARNVVASGIGGTTMGAARVAVVRARLDREGHVWLSSLLEDLERTVEAYHARSARYSHEHARRVLVEIEARRRALARPAELPRRYVLGDEEAAETQLDHVRLVSLGARLHADGEARSAEVFLADPDTATVLVLRKRWSPSTETGPALARRPVSPRIGLGQLAHGQLVSKTVRRRANRSIEIGASRLAQSSVTPQDGSYESLPAPLLVRAVDDHLRALGARPPWMLRPRVLAETACVVAVSRVVGVGWDAAAQSIVALLLDEAGTPFRAIVSHRAVAPHAVDATSAAFGGEVRFVTGEMSRDTAGPILDVLAIAGERLVVPDLAEPAAPSPHGRALAEPPDPTRDAEARANGVLEELLVPGVAAAPTVVAERATRLADELRHLGMEGTARRIAGLAEALRGGSTEAAVEAWLRAGVWLALMGEAE